MREIKWNKKAFKQINQIPKNYRKAIGEHVNRLKDFPNCENLDIISLNNHKHEYRIRVGRYRVFFNDQTAIKIISIQEVKKRDERTY